MSTLTLTTIQTSLYWEDKSANLRMLEEKIMGIKEKTEIVLLPEMFATGFTMQPEKLAETMDGEVISWMKKIAETKKVILTGSVAVKENEQYYNRLIWMLPNGQSGYYDKRHLFAFAGEDQHYTAGNRRLIASVKGWKVNLQVCYDLRFPVWARQSSFTKTAEAENNNSPEYDLLIYVANWPERRRHAWKTLLQARAIENQCYVAGVNRVGNDGNGIYHSGDTMVVDPLGEVLYTRRDEEDIHTLTLDKNHLQTVREKLPFLKDADGFMLLSGE
ncbi:MAG: amidohydrolase [Chitinophagaceae bacterium]|nr:amidohydrolase [Chitinophagaceae bacterium]